MFNQNNVGEAVSSFIEKSKKQAKKILKISNEKDGRITIENLAQAQDLVAKFNGYPNWHAMQETHKKNKESKKEVGTTDFQLSLVSQLNHQTRYINLLDEKNQCRINFVIGQPGVGKSTIKDKVITEGLKNNSLVSRVTLLDIGKKYYKDYGLSHQNELLNIDIYNDSINLLETPLGLDKVYPEALKEDIHKTLMIIMGIDDFSAEYHAYTKYFEEVFQELKENPIFNKNFDNSVESITQIIKDKSKYIPETWVEVSHLLMKLNYVEEAKIAHKKSCCNLKDFLVAHMKCFEKTQNKVIDGNQLTLFLKGFEKEHLNLTKNENVYIGKQVKFVNASLDLRLNNKGVLKNSNNFIANVMMVFLKRESLQTSEYFNASKNDYEENLVKNRRLRILEAESFYQYNQKIAKNVKLPQLIAFDESHRFSNFSIFNDLCLKAKEQNLNVLIISQYTSSEWKDLENCHIRVLLPARDAKRVIQEDMFNYNIVKSLLLSHNSLLLKSLPILSEQLTMREWYFFEFENKRVKEDIVMIE